MRARAGGCGADGRRGGGPRRAPPSAPPKTRLAPDPRLSPCLSWHAGPCAQVPRDAARPQRGWRPVGQPGRTSPRAPVPLHSTAGAGWRGRGATVGRGGWFRGRGARRGGRPTRQGMTGARGPRGGAWDGREGDASCPARPTRSCEQVIHSILIMQCTCFDASEPYYDMS